MILVVVVSMNSGSGSGSGTRISGGGGAESSINKVLAACEVKREPFIWNALSLTLAPEIAFTLFKDFVDLILRRVPAYVVEAFLLRIS